MDREFPKPPPPGDIDLSRLVAHKDAVQKEFDLDKWLRQKEQAAQQEYAENDPSVSYTVDSFLQGRLSAFREVRQYYEENS